MEFGGGGLRGCHCGQGIMKENGLELNGRKLRLLVAIASYGDKNIGLLRKIIGDYQKMPMDVDVIVLSNASKELGPGVRVIVGLPSKDPWSLPFAHKPVLAENADKYDLFIYSEDDMAVTERNIQAFLDVTPQLDPSEIAGYIRYEVDQAGHWSFPDVHGASRWTPESVHQRGDHVVAEYTNEHAAFYILTQAQLKRAVASGGFLRAPCTGRYDMACTAATDPYTNCGFRKVVSITAIDDFLIHHLSNRYAGRLGVTMEMFREQIEALKSIQNGSHAAATLCSVESRLPQSRWSKSLYEEPDAALLELIPVGAKTILSVGCGWGAIETRLKDRGAQVAALALDSVIAAGAAKRGIEVIYGTLEQTLTGLGARRFECVFMTNLLHLVPNPEAVLEVCAGLVGPKGTLLVSSPNFKALRVRVKQALGAPELRNLGDFAQGGIAVFGPRKLARNLHRSGFREVTTEFPGDASSNGKSVAGIRGPFKILTAREWILQARR
jgi:2-polyprenyl-3-methyl-5-hydroxy-6-metoxy-1,4-benzoquinol methylase